MYLIAPSPTFLPGYLSDLSHSVCLLISFWFPLQPTVPIVPILRWCCLFTWSNKTSWNPASVFSSYYHHIQSIISPAFSAFRRYPKFEHFPALLSWPSWPKPPRLEWTFVTAYIIPLAFTTPSLSWVTGRSRHSLPQTFQLLSIPFPTSQPFRPSVPWFPAALWPRKSTTLLLTPELLAHWTLCPSGRCALAALYLECSSPM